MKPTIQIRWDLAKKDGIIDGDFYLADLLSEENKTLKEKLFVLLKSDYYALSKGKSNAGLVQLETAAFSDGQKAHTLLGAKYERPPQLQFFWMPIE